MASRFDYSWQGEPEFISQRQPSRVLRLGRGIGDFNIFDDRNYRLIDRRTGKVLAANPDELKKAIESLGDDADWAIEEKPTDGGDWGVVTARPQPAQSQTVTNQTVSATPVQEATVNQELFNRPLYGVNEAALTYAPQGTFTNITPTTAPEGWMEDVVRPDVGSATPVVQQNLQPIVRNGETRYELPSTNIRYQGREGIGDIGIFPGMDYRLVDRKTGEVLTTDPSKAPGLIASLNERDGKFSNWVIEQRPAGSNSEWSQAAQQAPEPPSALGTFADIGLTTLGAIAGGPLGAAAGSGLSSVIQGRPLGESLLRAGLSAGTTFGLGELAGTAAGGAIAPGYDIAVNPAVSGLGGTTMALPSFAAPTLSGIGGAIAGSVPGEILVTAPREAISSGLAGALGGAAGGVSNIFGPMESGNTPMTTGEELTVIGQRPTADYVSQFGGIIPAPTSGEDVIEVSAPRDETVVPPFTAEVSGLPIEAVAIPAAVAGGVAAASGGGGAAAAPTAEAIQANAAAIPPAPEMVVTAAPISGSGSLGAVLPGLAVTIPAMAATSAVSTGATAAPKKSFADWLQLGTGGLALISGIGGLIAGNGNRGGSGAGIGGFNPNMGTVSYTPLNRQQNAPTFDPFTYGQSGGEFRFFDNSTPEFQINQGITPPAAAATEPAAAPVSPANAPLLAPEPAGIAPAGIGDIVLMPEPPAAEAAAIAPPNPEEPVQFARGGQVRGIGGGQDDLIDAKLSDGEYVFSAQDVADLGDGSNEAGARKLDQMRRLIRKQAGRKNVKTIARRQKSVRSILEAVQ